MNEPLDAHRLREAFDRLGADLAERGAFIELAVYGGSALILQFSWRRTTWDVDAVVRSGYEEAVLAPSVAKVAAELDLDPGWLNNAVGMFTPLEEDDSLFAAAGSYPAKGSPGLRVVVARPPYLLAMKLQALRSLDRGERDMVDARALASHLGIESIGALAELYASIFGEDIPADIRLRLPAVLKGVS